MQKIKRYIKIDLLFNEKNRHLNVIILTGIKHRSPQVKNHPMENNISDSSFTLYKVKYGDKSKIIKKNMKLK